MYRSASTLQFQITSRLVQKAKIGQPIGWIDAQRFAEVREAHKDKDGLKVIKVHTCTEPMRQEFLHDRAIGIYTHRDVRDVYASSMKQRLKSFADLQQERFLEQCLDNYAHWTTLPRVVISTYENLVHDLPTEVQRIATHLNIDLNPADCQAIASDYDIQMQQQRIDRFQTQLLQTERAPNDHRTLRDYHDEENLLHIAHIDSGRSGRWQDDLTPEQVKILEDQLEYWCESNHYSTAHFVKQSSPIINHQY